MGRTAAKDRALAAFEEVKETLNRQFREGIISYEVLKAGVNNAGHVLNAVTQVPYGEYPTPSRPQPTDNPRNNP